MKTRNSKSRRIFLMIAFLGMALTGLSACGKQVEDWVAGAVRARPLPTLPISFKSAAATEFVPASRQYQSTLQRGYLVSSSGGGMQSEVVQTSQSGYKIYSSVQGVVISDDVAH